MANTPTRVEVDMPKLARSFHLRSYVVIGVLFAFGIAGFIDYWVYSPSKPLPLKGICVDVPMKMYIGEGDKDGQLCIWRNLKYWCIYDPNKNLWSCQSTTEEVLPEKNSSK